MVQKVTDRGGEMRPLIQLMAFAMPMLMGVDATTGARATATKRPPPIEARLLPPFYGQLIVELNQPAYVAIFDVKTSRGAQLLYPGPNGAGEAVKGINTLPVITLGPGREELQVLFTPDPGGNDYLWMVASRQPLDLSRWANAPIALTEAGHIYQEALAAPDQIDSLERYILPPMADRDWDEDVFILAPGVPSPNGTGNYLLCADGSTRLVPPDYPFLSCRHGSMSTADAIDKLTPKGMMQLAATAASRGLSVDAARAPLASPASVTINGRSVPITNGTGGVVGSGTIVRGDHRDALGGGGSVSHGGSPATASSGVASSGGAGGAVHVSAGGRP